MRLRLVAVLSVGIALLSGCRGPTKAHQTDRSREREERERIDLSQNVTTKPRPEDKIFIDFEKNWRQFISQRPEFTRPVISRPKPDVSEPEPIVQAECVYSADAGGLVPQVTITWNQAAPVVVGVPAAAQRNQPETPEFRLDLGLHQDAFARNYFTSGLSTQKLQRFNLPSNSALINNAEAVLLTGPGLFPKLMDFRTELLRDRDTNRQFDRQTAVIRDLNQGLSYTLRVSHDSNQQWSEERRIVFLTPVCPKSF
jgi:hypothetical protein